MHKEKLDNSLKYVIYELKKEIGRLYDQYIFFGENGDINVSIKIHELSTNKIFYIDFINLFLKSKDNEELIELIKKESNKLFDNKISLLEQTEIINIINNINVRDNLRLEITDQKRSNCINIILKNNLYALIKLVLTTKDKQMHSFYLSESNIKELNIIDDKYSLFNYLKLNKNNKKFCIENDNDDCIYYRKSYRIKRIYEDYIGHEVIVMNNILKDICVNYKENSMYLFPISKNEVKIIFESDILDKSFLDKVNKEKLYLNNIFLYKINKEIEIC